MGAKQGAEKKKESLKNSMMNDVAHQLSAALPELKEMLGEKKFGKRVKRAAKLLSEGTQSTGPKNPVSSKPVITITPPEKKKHIASPVKKLLKPVAAKK